MKKIVILSLALSMVIGIVGVDSFAFFTNTVTSSGNQILAGTLDLKTNDTDGVSQTLYATSMSPGATIGPATITLKNAGTTSGATMDISFSYAKSDGNPNFVVKTADAVAAMLQVNTLTYDVTNLLATLTDINGNGYIDVQDLTNTTNVTKLAGLSGLNAGAIKNFVITLRLRGETGNDFQADGITVTMTFTLKQ